MPVKRASAGYVAPALSDAEVARQCKALSEDFRVRPRLEGLRRYWQTRLGTAGCHDQERALLEEAVAEGGGILEEARKVARRLTREAYNRVVAERKRAEVSLEDADANLEGLGDRDLTRSEIDWGGEPARRSGKNEFLRGALQEAVSVGPFAARLSPDETERGRRRDWAWRGMPKTVEECRDVPTIRRMLRVKAASCAETDGTAEAARQYAEWTEHYLGLAHTPTQQTIRNWCRTFGYEPKHVREAEKARLGPAPLADEL